MSPRPCIKLVGGILVRVTTVTHRLLIINPTKEFRISKKKLSEVFLFVLKAKYNFILFWFVLMATIIKEEQNAYEKGLCQLPKRVLVSTVCTACTDG